MLMLISLAFALRHKHNISTRSKHEQCSFFLCLCYAYVMLMSWVFSLAYASVCAYAYACAYALVKTSLYRKQVRIRFLRPRICQTIQENKEEFTYDWSALHTRYILSNNRKNKCERLVGPGQIFFKNGQIFKGADVLPQGRTIHDKSHSNAHRNAR